MDDPGGSHDGSIEEEARRHNTNLQRLIETIGTTIAASRDLLRRLQPAEEGSPLQPMDQPDAEGEPNGNPGGSDA